MAGPKPRQSRDAAAMSKTTKIKIPTRIMTTYLPCLDTTMTIKSCPLFFGEESVYFGEPRGEEVPHSVRLADTAVEQQGRRSLSPANGICSLLPSRHGPARSPQAYRIPRARCLFAECVPEEWRGPSRRRVVAAQIRDDRPVARLRQQRRYLDIAMNVVGPAVQ